MTAASVTTGETIDSGSDADPKGTTHTVAPRKRRTPALLAALVFAASSTAFGSYWLTLGVESTDDAQIDGHITNVAARVAGQVQRVHVKDNQLVNSGDVLFELDPADYAVKVEVARSDLTLAKASAEGARAALALTEKTAPANLTQARGGMTSASSSFASAQAGIRQAQADLSAAESRKALAALTLSRSRALLQERAIPKATLDAEETNYQNSEAQVDAARAKLASAQASLSASSGSISLAKGQLNAAEAWAEQVACAHATVAEASARVQQAEAGLKLAELNLMYTTVRAPTRGVISKRHVEEGQMVTPERALLAIVPVDDLWVVANFKEDQLAAMGTGLPAIIHLDTYGKREFQGHITSISGGTGARFALLPPDNATGNFVKVVQRIPVLIHFNEPPGVDLRLGMSATVSVQTRR